VNCSATKNGCERNFWIFARARDRHFLVFAKFVDAQNGDDVLQVFVSLQRLLDHLRHIVMILPNDSGIKNARGGSQRIDRGIDSNLGKRTRKHRRGIEVSKRGGRRRIGQIVRRHVDRLHRSHRALLSRSNALLQLTHFGGQVGLITDGAGHAA
jgi:hypothetical protein